MKLNITYIIIAILTFLLLLMALNRKEKYAVYVESTGPRCNDLLCGSKKIGWDCCNYMVCEKGLHKCCSPTGTCECCDKYNNPVY